MANDDTLEQNWAVESMNVENSDDEVSICSDDEISDGENVMVSVEDTNEDNVGEKRARDDAQEPRTKSKAKKGRTFPLIHKLTASEQCNMLVEAYKKHSGNPELTYLDDLRLPKEDDYQIVNDFGKHSEKGFPRFLRSLIPNWKREFKVKNANETLSPRVIIISTSALRSVQLLKQLRDFRCPIAKLFSRHMKVQEQAKMLEKYHPIAVATPNRLRRLLELNYLCMDNTQCVVLDMARDSKDYDILGLKDTRKDLIELFQLELYPFFEQKSLKIALY